MVEVRRVLVLGGTAEARELAARLGGEPAVHVISSLAGRVRDPRLPEGEVRIGGFGGAEGLAAWLRAERIDEVVDATHPFAAAMTSNAVLACALAGLPLLVLRRPGWEPEPHWHLVDSLDEAAAALPGLGERIFLSTGRQGVHRFAHLDLRFLVRAVDPPEPPLPPRTELLLARGPFAFDDEVALLREHRIDVLVTKDSGGPMTRPKLDAARLLGVAVVLVRRPPEPPVPVVGTVAAAVERLRHAG
ncbi:MULTISPECIES: cobalt-precorrin-6A reductase [unclassified Saccharopolyspora]|uniref:cobalt-precorrin-6A reductase n=1 Tax=unclassified Saccharopolyspora TaxID=2646250 RepID=UPI001CD555F2|nr:MULTISPECIES: cobalt-precorrin-6A reductase [unclassified Saccharopolyspora]MCA1190183.1 cobalt-precorrin-6A reductase [Saccharopolyspora sp. 6T]MCA1196200.1 cobalt-precorrin-6A reductase [Saccharopolyspora sp. 6V]MCA1283330.1 cobalt-precorrin-6A reductase [Saccharopolyspora sp. 7B]